MVGPHALHFIQQTRKFMEKAAVRLALHNRLLVGPYALHALEQTHETIKGTAAR